LRFYKISHSFKMLSYYFPTNAGHATATTANSSNITATATATTTTNSYSGSTTTSNLKTKIKILNNNYQLLSFFVTIANN